MYHFLGSDIFIPETKVFVFKMALHELILCSRGVVEVAAPQPVPSQPKQQQTEEELDEHGAVQSRSFRILQHQLDEEN